MPQRNQPPADAPVGTIWFGGPVDTASVSLRVMSPNLDPAEVSRLLGCEPSRAGRTGEVLVLPNGRSRTVKKGFWCLSSERQALDLAEQIESLLVRLTSDMEVWRSLTEQFEVDLFCGLFLKTTNRGLELPASLVSALGNRNLRIGFDIYAP